MVSLGEVGKMSKYYKKFNGKNYELEQTVWSKREAQNVAKNVRAKGMNARIVKGSGDDRFGASGEGWRIYVRRGKR